MKGYVRKQTLAVGLMLVLALTIWAAPAAAGFDDWFTLDIGWSRLSGDTFGLDSAESWVEPQAAAVAPVPIPGTAVLLASGVAGLLSARSRKAREAVKRILGENRL